MVDGFGYGAADPPKADNDNWRIYPDDMTPVEFLAWLYRTRAEMRQELAADFSLRSCPRHRRIWDQLEAIERCFHWHYNRGR